MGDSLLHAMEIIKNNRDLNGEPTLHGGLFCGFTPLHLKTFFYAALCEQLPNKRVVLNEGVYGDLLGSLLKQKDEGGSLDFITVAMEWEDFDARLGLRSIAGWSVNSYEDMLSSVRMKAALFRSCFEQLSKRQRVVVSLPVSPFLPLHFSSPGEVSLWEGELKNVLSLFGASLLSFKNLHIIDAEVLTLHSSYISRYSAESHLAYGFPYSIAFSSALGKQLAAAVASPQPLKGIVVDLDETLWKGILGENGIYGVSWDLDGNSHMHGVFQAFLQSLADSGILVAVASKNDPALVESLFTKRNPLLKRDSIFPLIANWGRKSVSIGRIIKSWNIGDDAVAFVDDSPLELAETQSEFPGLRTFRFPTGKPDEILTLIRDLRSLFAKDTITKEDKIRLESLKQLEKISVLSSVSEEGYEDVLRESRPKIALKTLSAEGDERAFELLNKTNQFNMNGLRVSDGEWKALCSHENGLVIVAAYEDKFGPLGKITVMAGIHDGERMDLSSWVMSCRAFGRRIEYFLLDYVFQKYGVKNVSLQYVKTERNGPFLDFLTGSGAIETDEGMVISREAFYERLPNLYHEAGEEVE